MTRTNVCNIIENRKGITNKMIIREIEVQNNITKSNLPDSDYVINPYVGCPHGCKYCYASFMKRFTGHEEEWGTFLDIKNAIKPIKKEKLIGSKIFISSVTDCYNPYEKQYERTRNILKELIDVDCKIDITTKSKLVIRDLDLIKKLENAKVAISINTLDEKFRKDMDHASTIKERIETLRILHDSGIKTVLFMSPIFPHITEWQEIIEKTQDYVDEYWFENLNLRGPYKKTILDYIHVNYPSIYSEYCDIYLRNNPEYWKHLSKEIETFCNKKHICYQNFFHHEKLVKEKRQIKPKDECKNI